jgi:hypothetical protein
MTDLWNCNSSWPASHLESSTISPWVSKYGKGHCIKIYLKLVFYALIILII